MAGEPIVAACPSAFDVRAILARSAALYGSEAAIAALTPFTIMGANGAFAATTVVEKDRLATTIFLAQDAPVASGVDETGPWNYLSGVRTPLRDDEAAAPRFDDWIARRHFLSAFDPARDHASCTVLGDGLGGADAFAAHAGDRARVNVTYEDAAIGTPTLVFDLTTTELTGASLTRPDGTRERRRYLGWAHFPRTPAALSFPTYVNDTGGLGTISSHVTVQDVSPGAHCFASSPRDRGAECVHMPQTRGLASITGNSAVVPFRKVVNQIILDAKLGTRDVRALLDSGASTNVIDQKTDAAFVPWMTTNFSGATQSSAGSMGELAHVTIGSSVLLETTPTTRLPMPVLDELGGSRPDLVLGLPIFLQTPVRIDYARSEIVLGEAARAHAEGATALPIHLYGVEVVVDAVIGTAHAPFIVDTGSSLGFVLEDRWAHAHGLPGDRHASTFSARWEAGDHTSSASVFRLERGEVGPVDVIDSIAGIVALAIPGVAGSIGNGIFSRCDAITIDLPARRLWIEGTCKRPVRERKGGFRFQRTLSRAWEVFDVTPNGPADHSGLRIHDRLVSIDGVPFDKDTLDVDRVDAILSQPSGTHVSLVVARAVIGGPSAASEAKQIDLRLLRP